MKGSSGFWGSFAIAVTGFFLVSSIAFAEPERAAGATGEARSNTDKAGSVVQFETSPANPAKNEHLDAPPMGEFDSVRTWLANQVDALHCPAPKTLRRFEARIYVACGETGLLILEAGSPWRLAERRELGGAVTDLIEHDGRLLALVQRVESRVVAGPEWESLDASKAPALPGSPKTIDDKQRDAGGTRSQGVGLPEVTGSVTEHQRGHVVIDLGEEDGIRSGMHIALFPDSESAKELSTPVVGIVRSTVFARAIVEIGINERVLVGYFAKPTLDRRTGSSTAPPRASASWSVAALIRPLVGLDQGGGGALVDASVGRRFSSAFQLRAVVEPLGIASGNTDTAVSASAYLLPSYDDRLVEAGLGLGIQTVNKSQVGFQPGTGTLFAPFARIGASDGLNLNARLDLALFHQQMFFTGLRIEMQIPLDLGTWLLLRGGGGDSGYGYGELGVRRLLSGNGLKGSVFLVFAIGGSSVFEQRCEFTEFFSFCGSGPIVTGAHFGAGFEARL